MSIPIDFKVTEYDSESLMVTGAIYLSVSRCIDKPSHAQRALDINPEREAKRQIRRELAHALAEYMLCGEGFE